MAATNEVVDAAQFPILIYVYAAVVLLCLASYRSFRAVVVHRAAVSRWFPCWRTA